MQQPHPIPYDSCGVALRFAGLPSADVVQLATGKRRWQQAVLACHELWHGEEDDPKCHLAKHEWDIKGGWPELLARSIEWDPTRPVTLTDTTTDEMLINSLFVNPLPLTTLRIPNAEDITDDGMTALSWVSTLTELDLSNTGITGKGLADLASLTQLVNLNLNETYLEECDLRHLHPMTQLKFLQLTDCGLSDVKELSANLPRCIIQHNDDRMDLGIRLRWALRHIKRLFEADMRTVADKPNRQPVLVPQGKSVEQKSAEQQRAAQMKRKRGKASSWGARQCQQQQRHKKPTHHLRQRYAR